MSHSQTLTLPPSIRVKNIPSNESPQSRVAVEVPGLGKVLNILSQQFPEELYRPQLVTQMSEVSLFCKKCGPALARKGGVGWPLMPQRNSLFNKHLLIMEMFLWNFLFFS